MSAWRRLTREFHPLAQAMLHSILMYQIDTGGTFQDPTMTGDYVPLVKITGCTADELRTHFPDIVHLFAHKADGRTLYSERAEVLREQADMLAALDMNRRPPIKYRIPSHKRPYNVQQYDSLFRLFWEAYPAKQRNLKPSAYAAWNKEVRPFGYQFAERVIEKAAMYAASQEISQDDRDTTLPETWLNNRGWEHSYER